MPLSDLPAHLANISIWNHLGDPSWGLDAFFAPRHFPIPYWLHYWPVHALSAVMPLEAAHKVFLSLYALALPISFLRFCERLGRSAWLAIFAQPLVFDDSFSFGYVACAAGVPLVFFTLTALVDFLASPSAKRWLAVVALALATFFMHLLPWVALGALAAVVLVAHARNRRRALAAAAALGVSLVVAAADFAWVRAHNAVVDRGWAAAWLPAHDVLLFLPREILTPTRGPETDIALGLLAASLLALLVTARPDKKLPFALFFTSLALFVAMPWKLSRPVFIWAVQPRFVVFVVLFLVACVAGEVHGRRRWAMIPALAVALAFPLVMLRAYRHFDARARGFATLLERVPRGASTLTLMLGPVDEPLLAPELEPFRAMPNYTTALNGGFAPYRFAIGLPYIDKPGTALPVPWAWKPRMFRQWVHGRFWDYVISDGEARDGELFADEPMAMIARAGEWRLYKTR